MHHSEGAVVKEDRDMLGSILDLPDMKVTDVMVHRKNMVSLNIDQRPDLLNLQISKNPFSRLPVWKDNPENIVGVLHVKTYMIALQATGGDASLVDVKSLLVKPWFVPAATNLKTQLKAFLRKRHHGAFVIDEYGVLLGMVTLEDILEEIVGQIEDEHDTPKQFYFVKEKSGSCVVEGTMPLRDLNREMDWNIPDEEAPTVAGLIINEAEHIPDEGQVFQFHSYRFEVVTKKRHQLTRVRVSRVLGEEGEGDHI
jgi:Mg2+/Co2+ transporter CorB